MKSPSASPRAGNGRADLFARNHIEEPVMRRKQTAVFVILLAAAAAPGQTAPGVTFPRAPAPGLLPPLPATMAQPQSLPSATAAQSPATARLEPGLTAPENVTAFDPQRTELVHDGNHWQLVVDGTVLTDFGAHEKDARVALRLVRDLGLNQHAKVGAPAPVMEYWLHDGKAPHGVTNGLQVYPLEQTSLRVEHHEGDWCLRDAQRLLFNFGASADDANQALGVIRKYSFTQVGVLGQAGPVMLIFLGQAPAVSAATAPAPLPPSPGGAVRPLGFDPRVPSRGTQPIPVTTPAALVVSTGAAEANPVVERMPIDWRQAQVQKDGNVWKLTTDGHEIAKFSSERDAHLALSTLLYYHFTEREQVGSPKPHFSYFLVDGQVPRGAMIGVRCEVFQPERLRVVQVGDRWTISNGERVVLSFDDKQEEARHVLDVIQHNKCDRLCRIGLTDEFGLTFLARSR
jgi:hypothetical protein